jgi:hypothetical protein
VVVRRIGVGRGGVAEVEVCVIEGIPGAGEDRLNDVLFFFGGGGDGRDGGGQKEN